MRLVPDRQLFIGALLLLGLVAAALVGLMILEMTPRQALGSVAIWLLGRLLFRR